MTIHDGTFSAIDPTEILVDQTVLSRTLEDVTGNVNYLFKLATGEDLPGGDHPLEGHNHAESGGEKIPLWSAHDIGRPSVPFVNGYDKIVPFTRVLSSEDTSDYLWCSETPHPVVASYPDSTNFRIWVSGDQAGRLGPGSYVTVGDGVNRFRYILKETIYHSDTNTTFLNLFDYLSTIPVSGSTVRSYAIKGDSTLQMTLPAWADTLTLLIPACCTNSISAIDGERYFTSNSQSEYAWPLGLRLVCGSLESEWVKFFPRSDDRPMWNVFRLPLDTLDPAVVQSFHVEVMYNDLFDTYSPLNENKEHSVIWFRKSNQVPVSNSFALFTRNL